VLLREYRSIQLGEKNFAFALPAYHVRPCVRPISAGGLISSNYVRRVRLTAFKTSTVDKTESSVASDSSVTFEIGFVVSQCASSKENVRSLSLQLRCGHSHSIGDCLLMHHEAPKGG